MAAKKIEFDIEANTAAIKKVGADVRAMGRTISKSLEASTKAAWATQSSIAALTKELKGAASASAKAAQSAGKLTGETKQAAAATNKLEKEVKQLNTAQKQSSAAWQVSNRQAVSARSAYSKFGTSVNSVIKQVSAMNRSVAQTNQGVNGMIKSMGVGANRATDMARGFNRAERAMVKMHNANQGFRAAAMNLRTLGKQWQWVGRNMMTGIGLPVLLAGSRALNEYIGLNKELVRVQKVYGSGTGAYKAVEGEIRDLVSTISGEFAQSPKITAAIMGDLAAQGFTLEKGLGEMSRRISQVSLLGDVDLSVAKEQMTSMLAVFGQAEEADPFLKYIDGATKLDKQIAITTGIMSQFNAIENATRISMKEIANSFPEVALSAKQFNMSGAQTAAVMAVMAKQGLEVDESVTALKFAFARLKNPPAETKDKIKALGSTFSIFNKNGAKPGIESLVGIGRELERMGPKSEKAGIYLSELFGNRQVNRMSAALVGVTQGFDELMTHVADGSALTSAEIGTLENDFARAIAASGEFEFLKKGAEGFYELEKAAKEGNQGAINALAGLKQNYDEELKAITDSPAFKLAQARAKFSDALTKIGEVLAPFVIEVMDRIVKLVDAFNSLGGSAKMAILGLIAAFAALGPAVYITAQLVESAGVLATIGSKFLPFSKNIRAFSDAQLLAAGSTEKLAAKLASQGKALAMVNGQIVEMKVGRGAAAAALPQTAAIAQEAGARAAGSGTVVSADLPDKGNKAGTRKTRGHRGRIGSFDYLRRKQEAYNKKVLPKMGTPGYVDIDDFSYRSPLESAAYKDRIAKQGAAKQRGRIRSSLTGAKRRVVNPIKNNLLYPAITSRGGPGSMWTKMGGVGPGKGEGGLGIHPLKKTKSILEGIGRVGKSAFGGLGKAIGTVGLFLTQPITALKSFLPMLGKVISVGTKFSVIGAIIGVVVIAIMSLKKHWKTFYDRIQPGIKALKAAFSPIIEMFKKAISPIKRLTGLFGGEGGDTMKKFWEGFGNIVNFVMGLLAKLIGFMQPIFKLISNVIGGALNVVIDIIMFVIKLVSGDWVEAFRYLGSAAITFLMPVIDFIEFIVDAWLSGLQIMMKGISFVGGLIGKIPGLKGVGNAIQGITKKVADLAKTGTQFDAGKFLHDLVDPKGRNDYKKKPKPDPPRNPRGARDAGLDDGDQYAGGFEDGAEDALEDVDPSEWLSALKNRLDKAMDDLVKSAVDAFDKMVEARLQIIDDQIKAIEDQEKAEQQLLAEQEYVVRRQEMLKKRQIDFENYLRDRSLAIYEGRVDDARMLDLEQTRNTEDFNKELGDLDSDRARDVTQIERDKAKELLEIQKDQMAKAFDLQKEALEKELDLLKEFTPRNVGELRSRMGQMAAILAAAGVEWQGHGLNAGAMWAEAVRMASLDIADANYWNPKGYAAGSAVLDGAEAAAADALSGGDSGSESYLEDDRAAYGREVKNAAAHKAKAEKVSNAFMQPTIYRHSGGDVPGSGKKDVPATLQSGEYVIKRDTVSKMGKGFFDRLNQGHLDPMFHSGGMVGMGRAMKGNMQNVVSNWATRFLPKFMEPYKQQLEAKKAAEAAAARAAAEGAATSVQTSGALKGGGWRAITDFLTANSIPHRILSTVRKGAVTSTGNRSLHAVGKAVDLGDPAGSRPNGSAAMMRIFKALENIKSQLNEMFYSPAGYGYKKGRKVDNSTIKGWGSVYGDHLDHVHAGVYDKGGLLKPGLNMAMNKTGKGEWVMTNRMMKDLSSGLVYLKTGFRNGAWNISGSPVGGGATATGGGGGGGITILVENFIGEKSWFEQMMREYNIKVAPAKDRAMGTTNKNISSYADSAVKYRR